jgi:hypothetical protein
MAASLLLTQEQEAYLAWLLTPEDQREPATKRAYADSKEMHENTLRGWEKKKNFIERWKLGVEGLNQSPERTQKLLDALYIKGISGDTKSAELYLKATGNMPNASTLNIKTETSLRDISDEELEKMILELGAKQIKKAPVFPMSITEAN